MATNPYGRGGPKFTGSDNAAYAWQALARMLGREPTDQEVAQAAPSYQGADRNITNVSGGDAFVANLVKSIQDEDPIRQAQTAEQQSQAGATSIEEQYKNLMPTIQENYLDPLNTAIQQQRGTQTDQMNQSINQVQGLTGQGNDQIQQLLDKFVTQQQGFNQGAVGQQQGVNQDYINQLMGINTTQNDLLGQRMQSERDQLLNQLTNGPEGEAFRQKYNGLGLLNSGSFNTGLSNQFGNLASRQQQDILSQGINQQNQLAGAAGQGASALTGLGSQGLGALSGLGSQGFGAQSANQNQGTGAALGLAGQNFTNQSNLGIGGLAAQQEALQIPMNQGFSQYSNQQNQGNALQNALMQRTFNVDDFNQQSILGQLLAEQSQPSSFEKGLGYANGVSGAIGGLGQGAAGASQVTSYICLAMIDAGLLQQWQLDELHYHIMPAMWKKGRAFWNYAKKGQNLVQAAKTNGIDWAEYVDLFYTRVMDEPDPVKAVDLYAMATKYLCKRVAPDLWDERVLRTSLIDSLPFIPRLFTYKPFLETIKKVAHMRMLILYDNPQSRLKWR